MYYIFAWKWRDANGGMNDLYSQELTFTEAICAMYRAFDEFNTVEIYDENLKLIRTKKRDEE